MMGEDVKHEVYLGLGSNLGDRETIITHAIELIGEKVGLVIRQSSLIETEPWGFESENKFLNGVILVETMTCGGTAGHINPNKKFRAGRKQFKLESFYKYPKNEILQLTINRGPLFDFILGLRSSETRELKQTNSSLFLEKDIEGVFVRAEGTDPEKYYDLSSYNNGVFPFVIRRYKYLYLRNSQDFSGSQIFIELSKKNPFTLWADQGVQTDIRYSDTNVATDAKDDDICMWLIDLLFEKVLEYKLTPQDEEYLAMYKKSIEDETGEEIREVIV